MIGDIPSMEKGIPLIMEVIPLMVDGTIFILIEGRTSVTEQLGDRCTMKVWREEVFLHTFHQVFFIFSYPASDCLHMPMTSLLK
jgi:hypothetical protein